MQKSIMIGLKYGAGQFSIMNKKASKCEILGAKSLLYILES